MSTKKKAGSVNTTVKSKKRLQRTNFRASYKNRCEFSFSKSLEAIGMISEQLRGDYESQRLGLLFVSCYKSLGHSIEMLCKATLNQRSPFLVLEKLNSFDEVSPKEDALSENACGARVALARGIKLFKYSISMEEIQRLLKVIELRNQAQHKEFAVSNFQNSFHEIVRAIEILILIYNEQFRKGNLLNEADSLSDEEIVEIYQRTKAEASADFVGTEKEFARLSKQGISFITCVNCGYDFGRLASDGKNYACLWCSDERILFKCTHESCSETSWFLRGNARFTCKTHSNFFNAFEAIRKALESTYNISSSSILSDNISNMDFKIDIALPIDGGHDSKGKK
jgi:hypothetical protein